MQNAIGRAKHNASAKPMQAAYSGRMEVEEQEGRPIRVWRRYWLEVLITEAKGVSQLAAKTRSPSDPANKTVQPNFISQMKSGIREVGDAIATELEAGMKKPFGWMDRPPPSATETVAAASPSDLVRELRALIEASAVEGRGALAEALGMLARAPDSQAWAERVAGLLEGESPPVRSPIPPQHSEGVAATAKRSRRIDLRTEQADKKAPKTSAHDDPPPNTKHQKSR